MLEVPHAESVLGGQTAAPSWWFVTLDGRRVAVLRCSNGHRGDLTGHHVNPDGAVVPSVVCPEEGCDFHENVRLGSWPRGCCSCHDIERCYP